MELMCVAENMLPKMILRLIQHLRDKRFELIFSECQDAGYQNSLFAACQLQPGARRSC